MTPRVAGRGVGVVGVAGEADAVAFGDRHDALEEIVDALPVLVLVEDAGEAGRRPSWSILSQRNVELQRAAAAALGLRARDADDVEVVLGGRNAGLGEVLDQAADRVDLAVAVGALGEDVGALRALDRPRAERQLHHVELEPEAGEPVAVALEVIERPVVRIALRVGADVGDPELGELTVLVVGDRAVLRAQIHIIFPLLRRSPSGGILLGVPYGIDCRWKDRRESEHAAACKSNDPMADLGCGKTFSHDGAKLFPAARERLEGDGDARRTHGREAASREEHR